jgi:hypothetical protein
VPLSATLHGIASRKTLLPKHEPFSPSVPSRFHVQMIEVSDGTRLVRPAREPALARHEPREPAELVALCHARPDAHPGHAVVPGAASFCNGRRSTAGRSTGTARCRSRSCGTYRGRRRSRGNGRWYCSCLTLLMSALTTRTRPGATPQRGSFRSERDGAGVPRHLTPYGTGGTLIVLMGSPRQVASARAT